MDALTIKDEDEWQQSAPGRPPDDPTTLQRLLAATASPAAWTSYESITEALKSLLSLGFVVEQQQESPSPATELAHFITTTLLNFGLRHGSPSSFRFSLLLGEQTLHIPSRSQLLLLHLSRLLSINIFIFSSRTKPKAYIQSGSKSSVAFFHRIDSFYNTSEFCVLAFARHVNPGLNLAPLVQAPTNFSSPIRAAVFREGPRVTQRASNTVSASPDIEVCKEALRSVCMDRLSRDLKLEVSKILNKKKFKAGETKESLLIEKRIELETAMTERTSVPRGTLNPVLDTLIDQQAVDTSFSYARLRGILNDGTSLQSWKQVVQSQFDITWERTVREAETVRPSTAQQNRPKEEEDDNNTEQIRTCTTTFRKILRPDLMDKYDDIVQIATDTQETITNVIDELRKKQP